VTNEEIVTSLCSRLETLYMTKSLPNKLYFKKQLYRLCMTEGTVVLEHLNFFNKITSELLAIDSSFLELYDHIVTTMLYGKKTFILEEVTLILLSMRSEKDQIKSSRKDRVW